MAYAATVTGPTINVYNGRRHFLWLVSEVEAASTSEFNLTDAPAVGTVVLYKVTRTAGTGTTVNPALGRATSFTASTQNHIGTNTTTAASISDATNLRYSGLTAGKIFVRNTPNSAVADHAISTEIEIIEGVI